MANVRIDDGAHTEVEEREHEALLAEQEEELIGEGQAAGDPAVAEAPHLEGRVPMGDRQADRAVGQGDSGGSGASPAPGGASLRVRVRVWSTGRHATSYPPSVRIAALSDIHGNLPALEAVLADLERFAVDAIVDLGDIASGPLWPRETVSRLMALGWPTIAGNHERQVLSDPDETISLSDRYARDRLTDEQKAWFAGLPASRWLTDEVFLCHATPTTDVHYWLESLDPGAATVRPASAAEVRERAGMDLSRASLVLCGHTHVARSVAMDSRTLIVNPGSVGLPGFDVDQPAHHVVEAGTPHARYAVLEKRAATWEVTFRQVVYDWQSAAAKAAAEKRPVWARALATGRAR